MTQNTIRMLAIAPAVFAFACTPVVEDGVPEWLGEEAHFRIVGSIEGEAIDVGSAADGAALEVVDFYCRREYAAPLDADGLLDHSKAHFDELTLYATVMDGDEERYISLEFKSHDLQSDPIGTSVEVVPRVDGTVPEPTQMWFEWEWLDINGDEVVETAAQTGEFVLELYTGDPDEGGVVIPAGSGSVGGHLYARWSQTDEIELSFSAPCLDTDVDAEE